MTGLAPSPTAYRVRGRRATAARTIALATTSGDEASPAPDMTLTTVAAWAA